MIGKRRKSVNHQEPSSRCGNGFPWVVALVGVGTLLALGSCSTASLRGLYHGDASVHDFEHFPQRAVEAGARVRELSVAESPALKKAVLEQFGFPNLDSLMEKTRSQALLVIQGSHILLECYGVGLNRQSTVTSFSVVKSFVSVLIGKLIEEGKLSGVEQPITDWIPELTFRDRRFERIRVRDLLTMSSGIAYEEFPSLRNDNVEIYFGDDLRHLAQTKTEISEVPGRRFRYNNFNPLLLGLIIERASGMPPSEYLSRKVWGPMGAEASATWSLDSKESGFEKMESGLNARAVDFARFGCLVRDQGQWEGTSVVPRTWLQESLRDGGPGTPEYYEDSFGQKIGKAGAGGHYGYLWYGIARSQEGSTDFFAAGNKSQILYISPQSDLVIVRFGSEDGLEFWRWIEGFSALATVAALPSPERNH